MNKFAFPTPEDAYCGLTKLEYVSSAVLCAMISNPKLVVAEENDGSKWDIVTEGVGLVEFAISQARELLEQVPAQ